nr:LysR substrate-binding domain-containing protein [Comamonas jiangduensis]
MEGPIRQFRQQYPNVSIALEIYGTNEIVRRVREDAAEIGLVYYAPADSRITSAAVPTSPCMRLWRPATRSAAWPTPHCSN